MSSKSDHTEYKIYLDSSKKEKILDNAKTYEKYVILQNETLHTNVNELNNEVKRLECFVEELEEDNSRMEKSKGYTKNLLKNFAELDKLNIKWRKESNKHYKEIQVKQKKIIKSVVDCVCLFQFFASVYVAVCFYYFNGIFRFMGEMMIYGVSLYLSVKFINNNSKHIQFNLIEKTDKVKTINEDIKKINECYDFIHEYIDNV